MTSFWKSEIPRCFPRYEPSRQQHADCIGNDRGPAYFGGSWTSKTGASHMRPIIVYVQGFDTHSMRPGQGEAGVLAPEDPLMRFSGEILLLDEDCLVLTNDEFTRPILIPWYRIRYIQVG
jgi:hypothetical protein